MLVSRRLIAGLGGRRGLRGIGVSWRVVISLGVIWRPIGGNLAVKVRFFLGGDPPGKHRVMEMPRLLLCRWRHSIPLKGLGC